MEYLPRYLEGSSDITRTWDRSIDLLCFFTRLFAHATEAGTGEREDAQVKARTFTKSELIKVHVRWCLTGVCICTYSWYEVLRIHLYFNSKSILPLGVSSLLQTHKHGILLEDSGRDAYQHIRMEPWNLHWVSIPSDYSLVYIGVASGFRPECLGKLLLAPSPSQLNIIRFCRLSLQRPGRIKTILSLHMRDPMF